VELFTEKELWDGDSGSCRRSLRLPRWTKCRFEIHRNIVIHFILIKVIVQPY